ncbi:hypothetical protein E2C01_076260 [Portunus trituberculatus]|uniref:Uncharacterized protein n=1 Tax=Portunus trituberculatus TaxID=210409 RepID=A0A5B7ICT1_PORTR|nr:hypothetical protein [Portunus trituberculatus]
MVTGIVRCGEAGLSVPPVLWVFTATRAATTEAPHVAHTPLRRDRSRATACRSVREPLARVAHHGCLRGDTINSGGQA